MSSPRIAEFPQTPAEAELDLVNDPVLATAHLLAGALMEICGPFFWAVLASGFFFAEFWLD